MSELTFETIWKKYQAGLDFNEKVTLLETVKNNENFYIGKQWEGVQSNGLPTPVFNMLKQIVQHQVASITSDNIKMNASPLRAMANDEDMEKLTAVVNKEFAALFEQNYVTSKLREYARNAAVDGDSCLFTYWDDEIESPVTEVIENTRVFFGNPNDKEPQHQPYIIIARRAMLDEVKRYAEEHGGDADAITADTDDNSSELDNAVEGKVTRLLYMWKDIKTKSIHAMETTQKAVLRPEWDMDIRRYPITWLPWDYIRDSYHGQALISGLINNQEFINKAYAASMLSIMMSAFPKVLFDKNRVVKWTNQVGAQIGVNGDVTNVARVLEPAQISPQVAQFINSAIDNTQSFTGATAAALGNTRPDNTSAIIALQRAAAIPSEITKQNLYKSVEDLGRIYIEFMAFYYGKREVDVFVSDVLPEEVISFAGVKSNQQMRQEFDFSRLRDVRMHIKLDVGASAYWSEIASMQTLDNLLQLGQITLVDYLERIPDGYISKRQELLDKYKAKETAVQPAPEAPPEEEMENPFEEMEIKPQRGNSDLQRAIVQSV